MGVGDLTAAPLCIQEHWENLELPFPAPSKSVSFVVAVRLDLFIASIRADGHAHSTKDACGRDLGVIELTDWCKMDATF